MVVHDRRVLVAGTVGDAHLVASRMQPGAPVEDVRDAAAVAVVEGVVRALALAHAVHVQRQRRPVGVDLDAVVGPPAAQEARLARDVHERLVGPQERPVEVVRVLLEARPRQQALRVPALVLVDREVAQDPDEVQRHLLRVIAEDRLEVHLRQLLAVLLGLEGVDHVARGGVVGVVRDDGAAARLRDVLHLERALLEVPGLAAVPAAVDVVRDQVEVRLPLPALHAGVAGVHDQAVRVLGLRDRGERSDAYERRLVPDRPHHDARVVVVLADHLARDRLAGREVHLGGVRVAVLRPDQDAALVRQVVLELRVRVVGEADEVHAQVLEAREVVAQLVVGDGGPVRLGLLVLSDAAQQDRLPVQEEAPVLETEVAEAGALLHAVLQRAARPQLGLHAVEVRGLERPERRRVDARLPARHGGSARPWAYRHALDRHLAAARVAEARDELQVSLALVADPRPHLELGAARRDARRRHVDAGRRVVEQVEVRSRRADQPYLAVEAAVHAVELLAVAGRQRVDRVVGMVADADGQDVRAVRHGGARIEGEPRERADVLAEVRAVHVDVGARADALERQVRAASVAPRGEGRVVPRAAPRLGTPGVRHGDGLAGSAREVGQRRPCASRRPRRYRQPLASAVLSRGVAVDPQGEAAGAGPFAREQPDAAMAARHRARLARRSAVIPSGGRIRSGADAVAQPAQRQLDVHDQRFRRVVQLVEHAVELAVVRLVRLVRLRQDLEPRGPLHQALEARLAVRVHVRGLGVAEVQAAEERADLAAPVLGALDDARERATSRRAVRQERLDGAAAEALVHPLGEAHHLAAVGLGQALLHDDLVDARLEVGALGGDGAAQQVLDLLEALRPRRQQQVARDERLAVRALALRQRALPAALLRRLRRLRDGSAGGLRIDGRARLGEHPSPGLPVSRAPA